MKTADDFENVVSDITNPERATRLLARGVVLIILFAIGLAAIRIVFHLTNKVEFITHDRDWFINQKAQIESVDAEIVAASDALARHLANVEARRSWFSITRQSDLDETSRFNQELLGLEAKKARLVASYDAAAASSNDDVIAGLPKRLQYEQKDQ